MSFLGKIGKPLKRIYSVGATLVNDPLIGPAIRSLPFANAVISTAQVIRREVVAIEAIYTAGGQDGAGAEKAEKVRERFEEQMNLLRAYTANRSGKGLRYNPEALSRVIKHEADGMNLYQQLVDSIEEFDD